MTRAIKTYFLLQVVLYTVPVFAQDVLSVTATAIQLAGQNVYLNVGADKGIVEGDTLQVMGENGQLLRILSTSRKQSVATFAGAPFPLTRGQQLVFIVLKGPGNVLPVEAGFALKTAEDSTKKVSIMDAVVAGTALERSTSKKVKVEGRLLLNLSALASETQIRSSAVSPVTRAYVTPSINLNATVSNLPSDVRVNVQLRTDYRYQSRNATTPLYSFRAYQLGVEKRLPFGEMKAGRFYNRFTQRGGYWDGVLMLVGTQKKGAGASAGFMPDRANEGFTTQFPRYALFAHFETAGRHGVKYKSAFSYNKIQPSSVFLTHRYANLEQRVDLDLFSLSQDLQLDQDPVSKSLVISHFQVNARLSAGNHVDFSGRYSLRQPYRLYNIDSPFLTRRDEYTTGVHVQLDRVSIGMNYASRKLNQQYEGRTLTGHVNTRPFTRYALSFTASVNHWASDFGSALLLNGGVAHHFEKIYMSAGYGFYQSQSPNLIDPINMHRMSMVVSVPFSNTLFWSVRGYLNQSQFLNSFSVNTSLHVRF